MALVIKKKQKRFNNKKTADSEGVIRDSKLEVKFYNLLEKLGVDFEKQHKELLQDTFRSTDGRTVRLISITIDAYIKDYDGYELFIDPKGFATETAILRFKMLEGKLMREGRKYLVLFLRDEKDVNSCAIRISKGMPLVGSKIVRGKEVIRPLYKKPY